MLYSITITITDKTAAAQNLGKLLSAGSQTGYTVVPSTGYPLAAQSPTWYELQADPGNGANKGFLGDSNTANDGSRQGRVLQAGDLSFPSRLQNVGLSLQNRYLRTDTNNSVFNLIVED